MELYRARVLEKSRMGWHALLRYEWNGPEPEPGQFVGVKADDSSDPFLPRPFFVHDREGSEVSLLFKVRGRGTGALAAAGDKGEEILVGVPRGRGFDLGHLKYPDGADKAGTVALVGGGVWVAPLKFLARRLRERGISYETYLESPAGAPEAYLRWLERAYPGAELVPTDGSAGAVVGALGGRLEAGDYGAVYVSGDQETLRAVSRLRPEARLAVRERMACMDGSCSGCAVPVWRDGGVSYARACVEGPVFTARELAW